LFDWETHQKKIKFRDTRLLPMAGRILRERLKQRITKEAKALKTCHTEFVHICGAAYNNGRCPIFGHLLLLLSVIFHPSIRIYNQKGDWAYHDPKRFFLIQSKKNVSLQYK